MKDEAPDLRHQAVPVLMQDVRCSQEAARGKEAAAAGAGAGAGCEGGAVTRIASYAVLVLLVPAALCAIPFFALVCLHDGLRWREA